MCWIEENRVKIQNTKIYLDVKIWVKCLVQIEGYTNSFLVQEILGISKKIIRQRADVYLKFMNSILNWFTKD